MPSAAPPARLDSVRIRRLDPNFTAILPGRCPARCAFCLEPEGPPPPSLDTWLTSFARLVESELPRIFRTVSLSGGEPTLSPVFGRVLEILEGQRHIGRLRRVVLTTNGNAKGLARHLDAIGRAVTHVNVSRHAVDDLANARVFHTPAVPSRDELAPLVSKLNRRGVLVNLNCVYSEEHAFGRRVTGMTRTQLRAEAKRYISFARDLGASSVVFRHDHRGWRGYRSTALERAFDDYTVLHHAQCESCHVVGKLIRGVAVNFKQSAYEPGDVHSPWELYELVLHSDGTLYFDWARLRPVERPLPSFQFTDIRADVKDEHFRGPQLYGADGCPEPPQDPCNLLVAAPAPFRAG